MPAETHEFTLPGRKQTRREDVQLHRGSVEQAGWITLRGLPVARPYRSPPLMGCGEAMGWASFGGCWTPLVILSVGMAQRLARRRSPGVALPCR